MSNNAPTASELAAFRRNQMAQAQINHHAAILAQKQVANRNFFGMDLPELQGFGNFLSNFDASQLPGAASLNSAGEYIQQVNRNIKDGGRLSDILDNIGKNQSLINNQSLNQEINRQIQGIAQPALHNR